jgi:RND superfamily putative drug exporter
VAGTNPNVAMLPLVDVFPQQFGLTGDVAVIGVVPSSAPQDQATTDLLNELRDTVNPKIEAATGAKLYVGGTQAITSDFTTVLKDALPIFLLVVIGLGFLALVLLFRSIIVPAMAAVTSLLSFAASLGITVAVFQWGWFNSLLGVSGTGPIMPFLPVMVFAILFGLSMDYQVFLVSRMREEWERTDDNSAAIRRGLGGSGRVVVIAALIMASVFLAFIPTPDNTIKLFGIALASAVLVDAFIIRLIFVPSLMSIIGRPNWWLPGWLAKILPVVHVESSSAEDEVDDVLPVNAGH